jgi:hypothetical protein
MKSSAKEADSERLAALAKIKDTIRKNLPKGFKEADSYGMNSFVVPHSKYPAGYHCVPKQPLPFISVANQKNFLAVYHMGLYADPELLKWFTAEYPKHCKTKLDMGKSCIRFKKTGDIPYELLGELAGKMTPEDWIRLYEKNIKK